jgi:hypothetical protein
MPTLEDAVRDMVKGFIDHAEKTGEQVLFNEDSLKPVAENHILFLLDSNLNRVPYMSESEFDLFLRNLKLLPKYILEMSRLYSLKCDIRSRLYKISEIDDSSVYKKYYSLYVKSSLRYIRYANKQSDILEKILERYSKIYKVFEN